MLQNGDFYRSLRVDDYGIVKGNTFPIVIVVNVNSIIQMAYDHVLWLVKEEPISFGISVLVIVKLTTENDILVNLEVLVLLYNHGIFTKVLQNLEEVFTYLEKLERIVSVIFVTYAGDPDILLVLPVLVITIINS